MTQILTPPLTEPRTTKTDATLWILTTIVAPLAFYFLFSSFYIGAWYARTHHQGPPPPDLIVRSMFICLPPAYWLTIALWFFVHRRRATFTEIFQTRSRSPLPDIAIGIALAALWIFFY